MRERERERGGGEGGGGGGGGDRSVFMWPQVKSIGSVSAFHDYKNPNITPKTDFIVLVFFNSVCEILLFMPVYSVSSIQFAHWLLRP